MRVGKHGLNSEEQDIQKSGPEMIWVALMGIFRAGLPIHIQNILLIVQMSEKLPVVLHAVLLQLLNRMNNKTFSINS